MRANRNSTLRRRGSPENILFEDYKPHLLGSGLAKHAAKIEGFETQINAVQGRVRHIRVPDIWCRRRPICCLDTLRRLETRHHTGLEPCLVSDYWLGDLFVHVFLADVESEGRVLKRRPPSRSNRARLGALSPTILGR